MKKLVMMFLFIMLLEAFCVPFVFAEDNMNELLNSSIVFAVDSPIAVNKGTIKRIDAPVFIHEDRGMIPIRYAAEWFGGIVSWNDENKCADIITDDKIIKIFMGKKEMLINGAVIYMDVAPIIVDDRSFVPIRSFVEALKKHAYFISSKKQIIISDYLMNEKNAINFCDYVNKNYNLYSELKIEDMKIPAILPMGKAYSLTGQITSDSIVSRIAVFIYDNNENQELKKTAENSSKIFPIKNIDNDISFSSLTSGEKRIEIWGADEAQSRLLFEASFMIVDMKNKFLWPVPSSNGLSGCYGQDGDRWHPAIDITEKNGSAVVACADGTVIDIYNDASDNFPKIETSGSGYGNYVKLEHTDKINGKTTVTKYNHLSKATVKVGDKLKMGDKLGEVGSTGSSTGFHLDFQLFLNDIVTDPGPFILIPDDIKFTGTTVDCCIPYIENLKAMQ